VNQETRSLGALTGLLRAIHVGRRSGALRAEHGDERHVVTFVQGQPVDVESTVPELGLPQLLLARGLMPAEAATEIEEAAAREHRPVLRAILDRGAVDKARLDEVRAGQLRSVVERVGGWTGVEQVFDADDGVGSAEAIAGVTMGDLILAAVAAVKDPNVARCALGNLDRIVVPSTDPLMRFQKITLKPTDGYLLSRIDGTLSARQVAQLIPASTEEVVRSLFGLHCAGLIEFLDVSVLPTRPSRGTAPPAPAPVARTPAPDPPAAPAPPPAAAKPAEPPLEAARPAAAAGGAAPTARKELDGDARRHQDVIDFHRDLKSKNHFEILGLTRSATEAQVRDAYFQLAKRYHPDVYRGPAFADVTDKIEAILVRLGEAFETLKDPGRRGNYESLLASREPRPVLTAASVDGPAAASGGPGPAGNSQLETRMAEEAVRNAEKLCLAEQFWDAIQAVEPHLGKTQGKTRVRARLVLAKCYAKNPNWLKRAEEQLNHLLEDDPKHVEAHFLLGSIYLGSGLRSRALGKFRKVLELNPEHEEARARVSELEPPPEATPAPSGGFIKRFLG
jgi:tetratricopeptide (TPR) repeat protein